MRAELDNYLVQKYPKIFVDRYESMQKTAMCWGFDHGDGWFWILDQLCDSIQKYLGYNSKKTVIKNKFTRRLINTIRNLSFRRSSKFNIIRKLLNYRSNILRNIANYIEDKSEKIEIETIPQVVATQVKEKFGTLCFYFDGGDDFIDGMVRFAEHLSACTCEFCGSTVNIGRTQGWISTICKDCYDNSEPRIQNRGWKELEDAMPSDVIKELRKIKIDKLNQKSEREV